MVTIILTVACLFVGAHSQGKRRINMGASDKEKVSDYIPVPYKTDKFVQQFFDEDSTHIFWTRYPDPFCCPCPKGTTPITQAMNFFCGLPGRVEIGILDCKNDTIVHKYEFPRDSQSNYTFWACYSESSIKDMSTKLKYKFLSKQMDADTEGSFKFVLMLNDKKKAVWPIAIPYKKDWTLILKVKKGLK